MSRLAYNLATRPVYWDCKKKKKQKKNADLEN